MKVDTKCPYCHAVSEIDHEYINKRGTCPACQQEFKLYKYDASKAMPPSLPPQLVKVVSIDIPFGNIFTLVFCSALAGAIIAFIPLIIIIAVTSR